MHQRRTIPRLHHVVRRPLRHVVRRLLPHHVRRLLRHLVRCAACVAAVMVLHLRLPRYRTRIWRAYSVRCPDPSQATRAGDPLAVSVDAPLPPLLHQHHRLLHPLSRGAHAHPPSLRVLVRPHPLHALRHAPGLHRQLPAKSANADDPEPSEERMSR